MFDEKEMEREFDDGHVVFIDCLVDFPIQRKKEENTSKEGEKSE